ncbi:MAG: hypothetical protein ACRDS1_17690 [Pseudonocardiaceae bacterium]
MVPQIPGGVTTPAQLRRIADGQCTTGAPSAQAYQVVVRDGEVVLRL